ncbi:MAG: caspase domain-containing protein [Hyphomicrobiaceae bacterium]
MLLDRHDGVSRARAYDRSSAARSGRIGFRFFALILVASVVAFSGAGPALAEGRRVALVIGNSKYRIGDNLRNPVQDAAAMQVALHRLNFELIVGHDLPLEAFREKVREFTKVMRGADIALLFYAGHGVQYKEQNYLMPADIEVKSESDIVAKSIALNTILDDMGQHAKASVVFLDACRNNPLLRGISRGPATGSQLTWEYLRGLATITAEPADRFVGFAASPGTVAEDGRGQNSPFTEALLRHIATPNIDISAMFSGVRRDVLKATLKRQQPESLNALSQPLYLNPTGKTPTETQELLPPPEESPSSISLSSDAEFWIAIKDTNDPKNFEDYLTQFPKGRFANLAKRKADQIKATALKTASTEQRVRTPEAATTEGDFVFATGIARITKYHPRDEAQRSAHALARAKAILAKVPATGVNLPNTVVSTSEAAELLGYMSRGITYDEVWTIHTPTAQEVKVDLRAKVRTLLGGAERKLNGQLEPTDIISERPFRLRIDAKKEANIGVFAWQANSSVIRLYPESMQKTVVIRGGESVWFPRAEDSYPAIASTNLAGERRNHEAIIIVTGAGTLPFDELVPASVGETAQQSLANSLGGVDFLNRLAAVQDPGLEVLVLPYEVRQAQ